MEMKDCYGRVKRRIDDRKEHHLKLSSSARDGQK